MVRYILKVGSKQEQRGDELTLKDMLKVLRSVDQDNSPKQWNCQRKEITKMLKRRVHIHKGIITILQHLWHVSHQRIPLDSFVFEVGAGTGEEGSVWIFDDGTEEEAHGREDDVFKEGPFAVVELPFDEAPQAYEGHCVVGCGADYGCHFESSGVGLLVDAVCVCSVAVVGGWATE